MSLLQGIGPEAELLTRAAEVPQDPAQADRIRVLLRHDLRWSCVLEGARRHWIMPLLFWHLNAMCPDAVPRAMLDLLRGQFRKNTVCNLVLASELLTLLDRFEAEAIRFLPFKGLTLATCAYGNLAMREAGDLDLL